MGARTTKAVFPDAFDQPVEVDAIDRLRASQKPLVNGEIRLLWQGRALWWKAPDLALMALRESLVRGVRVRLTMITDWSSPVGVAIRTMAENMGISSSVDFSGFMSREDLLRTAREHHAFFATSMHDSGGIPLIEAQSQGLPCLTPALGGNRDAHCPETGLRSPVQDGASFARGVAECLLGWQADPDVWARESSLAVRHATTFTRARIEQYAKNLIIPALQDRKISKAQ
jgi:glycosyltransferase involved in cell wall biosynthesis